MMKYYTSDIRVLELAKVVEKLYDDSEMVDNQYTLRHIKTLKQLLRNLKREQKKDDELGTRFIRNQQGASTIE